MKTINSKLRELNRGFVEKIKEGDTTWYLPDNNSTCGQDNMYGLDIKPISLSERLFKGYPIHVDFMGDPKKRNTLQLVVFVNNELKFTTKRNCFISRKVRYPKIKRSGWKIYTDIIEEDILVFRKREDADLFDSFCSKLKDGPKVNELFRSLCRGTLSPGTEEGITKPIIDGKTIPQ